MERHIPSLHWVAFWLLGLRELNGKLNKGRGKFNSSIDFIVEFDR